MEKTSFLNLLKQFITPLFTGCEIVGEEESSQRDSEVALGVNGVMLVKSDKNDDYRITLKRLLPFKNNDVMLVRAFLTELKQIAEYNISELGHIRSLQMYSLEKAICKTVCNYAFNTLHGLINELNLWSTKTYEGNATNFGFIVNDVEETENEDSNENLYYAKLLSKDCSALLSDGKFSCLEVDSKGYIKTHISIPQLGFTDTFSPFKYVNMAHQCYGDRIGLALLPNGDMLIFEDQELIFAKRRGQWNCFSHDEVIAKLAVKPTEQNLDIRTSIYLSALDTSFTKNGGCVCYLKKDNAESVLKHIDVFDILDENYYELKKQMEYERIEFTPEIEELENFNETYKQTYEEFLQSENAVKVSNLRQIIKGRKFNELNRVLRLELLGIDGATIIDSDGVIIAVGAIIKINAGSSGGGRLAAAKTLSKYGVAMKISADGIIEGFTYDRTNDKAKAIFSAG